MIEQLRHAKHDPPASHFFDSDTVDPVMDEQLAMFVVESHRRSHPSAAQASSATGGGTQGTGDEDDEMDNTAIINDKVQEHHTGVL